MSNFDHFWAEFLAKNCKPWFCENIAVSVFLNFYCGSVLVRFGLDTLLFSYFRHNLWLPLYYSSSMHNGIFLQLNPNSILYYTVVLLVGSVVVVALCVVERTTDLKIWTLPLMTSSLTSCQQVHTLPQWLWSCEICPCTFKETLQNKKHD